VSLAYCSEKRSYFISHLKASYERTAVFNRANFFVICLSNFKRYFFEMCKMNRIIGMFLVYFSPETTERISMRNGIGGLHQKLWERFNLVELGKI
jgi:hypothetical protein